MSSMSGGGPALPCGTQARSSIHRFAPTGSFMAVSMSAAGSSRHCTE